MTRQVDILYKDEDSVDIHPTAVIGYVDERHIEEASIKPVHIGKNVIIGPYSVICAGVYIDDDVYIEGGSYIRQSSVIGKGTSLFFKAYVGRDAKIGEGCKIGGLVCNRAVIGHRSAVLGSLLHTYKEPLLKAEEPSPVIGSDVLVAWGSVVVGGVTIGDKARIAANATVLRSVQEGILITGVYR